MRNIYKYPTDKACCHGKSEGNATEFYTLPRLLSQQAG
uniref:Uncharacterized protein n=1 Tax=Faecalibaculum rodentium TaxID=1702221 RepID=A0A140DUF1_9FIRM|nr:hypothetical protein AALO17_11440 [Faecalibaculum rodentium]